MIKRRQFIAGLGSAAAWPVMSNAQRAERRRRIGVLSNASADDPEAQLHNAAFLQRLQELGWTVGRNVWIDYRWGAAGNADQIRKYAMELVSLGPDVIVASGGSTVGPLQRATRTVPIVFPHAEDPVGAGLVDNLAHPGGNVTGFALFEATLGGKWLELLSEIAPGLKRAAIMFNPDFPQASVYMPSLETAARSLKVVPITALVHSDIEIETAVTALGREPGGGLVVMPDNFMFAHRAPIIFAAARNKVPAVYWNSDFARDGGLLSYGPDLVDSYRRAATYVNRILRGAKVGDLPVQFPTKFEMAVNLKTAKALGLTVPQSILLRADEVIE